MAMIGFASLFSASLVGSPGFYGLKLFVRSLEPQVSCVVGEQERNRATNAARKGLRAVPRPRQSDADAATQSMLEGLACLHPLVLAIDDKLDVIWLNDDLDIVSGGTAALAGRPLADLLRAIRCDDLDVSKLQMLRFIVDMKKNGRVVRARFDFGRVGRVGREAGPLPLEVSAFRMRDATGDAIFVCVVDRHEPRAVLEQKNDELEACVRGVSHDLRSPLVSLLGFSRLLREDFGEVLDDTGLHYANRINQAARHIEQLLQEMLELSRIGAATQCRVHVNPAPILHQLHSELKLRLESKNIELVLPEAPPTLSCDRTRLYQLFSNLIGNAIQHMDRASSARIEVKVETVSGGWQITVDDNGRGIPLQDHERIFRPFESAGRTGTHRKSSGLGLAIVKKIVESHSGRVWVESKPGAGARFVVRLPAR
jgi:signal transduction histidine kinase